MAVLVVCYFDDDPQSKMKVLLCPHNFLHCKSGKRFWCSRASNSEASSLIWLEIDFVRDFMHILVTHKFENDPFKMKVPS